MTVEHTIVTSTSLPSPAKPSLILIGTVTTKGNTVATGCYCSPVSSVRLLLHQSVNYSRQIVIHVALFCSLSTV